MKTLVLFDIDGTLLSTNGAARHAFHHAMLEVFRTAGPIDTHPFDGKTDPQIARELLAASGLPAADIDARLPELWPLYLRNLAERLARPTQRTHVYPGVVALLDALELSRSVLVGLLTGNVAGGAALKLASAGLVDRFRFGAYGSDAERRDALPAIAVQRAHELAGIRFQGEQVVIIGDTPADVACGRSLGVRAIAVATGNHTAGDLAACGAHRVFADLSDTDAVLQTIL